MLKLENVSVFPNPSVYKNRKAWLKIRLCFYILAQTHLMILSAILLSIDFTKCEDSRLSKYQHVRWKLLTAWFNIVSMAYFPICIYCDWCDLKGTSNSKHVKILNCVRYMCFTSLIFPTTAFADTIFWRLWTTNREWVSPPTLDAIVPLWSQHCMHTVTLIVAIIDLVIVPRKKPKSLKTGITIMFAFLTSYILVCTASLLEGEYMYPFLTTFTFDKWVFFIIYIYTEMLFYYSLQWCIIDLVWGQKKKKI